MSIAVCLFAYKRPEYLKKAISTHIKLPGVSYYAFVDHSEIQGEIINIIESAGIYDVIIKRYQKYGLNGNIRSGVDFAFEMGKDAVIVLEDDLLLMTDTIFFLKAHLEELEDKKEIFAVASSKGDALNKRFRCWAWGIWKDRWDKIDWSVKSEEKNNDSWDIIVNEYMNRAGLFCFCSDKERVKHIGWNGTHVKWFDKFSLRRIYNEWKNNYYRDKDILMKKEKFPLNVFRWFL